MSALQIPKLTPERLRALRRSLLNSAFGTLVFVIALYVCFPYNRTKDVVIGWASAQGYDVEIGSAGPSFGLGVSFKDILVRTRPTSPTQKPTRFTIEAARVSLSPLALVSRASAFGVKASVFGGEAAIDIESTKKGPFRTEVKATSINLADLPGVKEAINLPLAGTLELELTVSSKTGHYADAVGSLSFKCEGCVLGDGKTPFKVEGNPLLSGGLTLPKVRMGDFSGQVPIEKGTARLVAVEAKSADIDISIEGEIQLHDPLPNSSVQAYVRFKLSDALLKRADKLQLMLQMAGSSGKRPDGSYGVRLNGRLGSLNPPIFSPISPIIGTGTGTGAGSAGSGLSRPGIHNAAAGGFGRPGATPVAPMPMPPQPQPPAAALNVMAENPQPPPPPPPPPQPPPPEATAPPPTPPPQPPPPSGNGEPAPGLRGAPPGTPGAGPVVRGQPPEEPPSGAAGAPPAPPPPQGEEN